MRNYTVVFICKRFYKKKTLRCSVPGKRGTGWEEGGSSKNYNSTSAFSHSAREKSVKCLQKSSDSAKCKTII